MEYEYRYLSEERAKEIDAKGFVDNLGRKIHINSIKSIVNKDETIVFRQIWFSHEQDDHDKYFLKYKECYYVIDMNYELKKERKDNHCDYYDRYSVLRIYDTTFNKEEYQLEEILELLKSVVTEWNLKTSGKINKGDTIFTKLIYKGEEI